MSLHSEVVATVHHGDRLEIVAQRRRLLRVRTPSGAEGWTDDRSLMQRSEIESLQKLSLDSRRFPSQGQAQVYDIVNVHTQPQRTSPSYLQIKPGEKVDVIGHEVVERSDPPRKPFVVAPPKSRIPPKKKAEPKIPPVPKPPPPGLPRDYRELSQERSIPKPPVPEKEVEPLPKDDWTLVRVAGGQSGWVLTRRLSMAIPDEVAQYAEGKRIVSYFSLGKTRDGDLVKDIWLWTTAERGIEDHDFDSFRVFIWSLRHHRYETSYIQRRVVGFSPVLVGTYQGRTGFSVCVENGDDRVRKQFVLVENRIQAAGQTVCLPSNVFEMDSETESGVEPKPGAAGFFARLKKKLFSH